MAADDVIGDDVVAAEFARVCELALHHRDAAASGVIECFSECRPEVVASVDPAALGRVVHGHPLQPLRVWGFEQLADGSVRVSSARYELLSDVWRDSRRRWHEHLETQVVRASPT